MDCLVVVGTTLTTGLPNQVVQKAKRRGIPIINLDPSAAAEPREGMLNHAAKSGEALPKVVETLARLLKEPNLPPLRGEKRARTSLAQLAAGARGAKAAGAGFRAVQAKAKAKTAPKAAPRAA